MSRSDPNAKKLECPDNLLECVDYLIEHGILNEGSPQTRDARSLAGTSLVGKYFGVRGQQGNVVRVLADKGRLNTIKVMYIVESNPDNIGHVTRLAFHKLGQELTKLDVQNRLLGYE